MMASAFDVAANENQMNDPKPSSPNTFDVKTELSKKKSIESETEDEEVKMNCVGGFRGIEDSDMNTSGRSDDEDDLSDDDDDRERGKESNEGVVTFVSDHLRSSLPLLRPKATSPERPALSPHDEEGSDIESDSDSTASSVGARGVAFSLGTPSALSDASPNASNESEEENDGEEASDDESDEDAMNEDVSVDIAGDRSDDNAEEDEGVADVEDELSGLIESLADQSASFALSDQVDLSLLERCIGVKEDREDPITIPKAKRVLSFNTLAALNAAANHSDDSPKRFKKQDCGALSPLPPLSLGPAALSDTADPRSLKHRQSSPVITSSDEEEELDGQLRDELGGKEDSGSRENTPVPLLTPPASPSTVEVDGNTTTICEWPSNLYVDSALQAVSELRPMSPDSLQDFEREEEDRVAKEPVETGDIEASTLTPLLRGIYVE